MTDKIKILIVDDDPEVLLATKRVAQSEDHQVVTASTGVECMDMVKKHHPDLILLDVVLPDTEGVDICRRIKEDPTLSGTFIVLISGMKTSSDEQATGLDEGADGYIARPISNRELKARINAMVRILKAERERDRLVVELQEALKKIKQVSGLLPICAHCKKIRDDKGYWTRVESYIERHSEAEFSHGICPDCLHANYPDI